MVLKMQCMTEYGSLKKVIVCSPRFLSKVNNANASIDMAIKQHHHFVSTLRENGIEVVELESFPQFPEQVFTRDIGFVIGEKAFVSKMANYLRLGEEAHFRQWLDEMGALYTPINVGSIEGGDVIVHENTVFVGLSNRTNKEGAQFLQSQLPDYEVWEVPFTDAYLHLDCVFNILSPTEAVIFPEEIHGEMVKKLKNRFDLIEITKEEQANLATNVLSIGEKRIISLPINQDFNKSLKKRGYEVIEVEFTEIIKFGGSFRCCTLPILRLDS